MRNFGKFLVFTLVATLLPLAAFAQEAGAHGGSASNWGAALGAGLAFGLAGLGCGLGQGLTAGNTTASVLFGFWTTKNVSMMGITIGNTTTLWSCWASCSVEQTAPMMVNSDE